MDLNQKVFENKTVEDLIKEIYNKHKEQESKINNEITRISNFVNNPGDAIVLVPLLKGFLDSSLQNDQTLMKLIQIFQRADESKQKDGSNSNGVLTEQDIQQLFESVDDIQKQLPKG